MAAGGKRAGAGRPRGAKDRFARRRKEDPLLSEIAPSFVPLGIDPKTLDPKAVLAAIAADVRAPAMARVAACKILISTGTSSPELDKAKVLDQRIATRALDLLARGRMQ
jgi:hypothetical protein